MSTTMISTTPVLESGLAHESSTHFERPRYVLNKVFAEPQQEREGAIFRRSIGRTELMNLDPFVLFFEFFASPPAAFRDHPHRGFEAATYMLEGAINCQDFTGHKSTISAGDFQWLAAGKGIIHAEIPRGEGVSRGLQLWIKLSSEDKMMEPRCLEIQSKDISRVEKDGVAVRIMQGEAFGVCSPVHTRTPTMFLDFTLKPGAQVHQPIPQPWNAFAYIVQGEGVFGDSNASPATSHHALVLSPGDGLSVWNRSAEPLRFLLVGGQPLNEPVVLQGPFVMNTQAEIEQAIEDYRQCKNGFEKAKDWKSQL